MGISKKKKIVAFIAIFTGLFLGWIVASYEFTEDNSVYTVVRNGVFEVNVFTTGELEAKNSVSIVGPAGIRTIGLYQVKISDIIPEGTVVKQGDFIANLDKAEIMTKIKDGESDLSKIETRLIQNKLDTALDLRRARDDLINLDYNVSEKQIILDQSTYEPPATIKQAKNDLDKAIRELEQSKQNYKIRVNQAEARIEETFTSLKQSQNRLGVMNSLLDDFTITAPKDGMLIYQREWNGKKKIVGSTISAWDPTVAILPDLTVMISKTFVNEVDIRKVKKGQNVRINLDAFPDKHLTGKVISVANVGEQMPKSDAKVFEVNIQINERDTSLRPAMTTGNNILAERLDNVLFIPLEAIHTQGDSTFVFKKKGLKFVKKQVKIGKTNDTYALILKGLKEGELISISEPADAEKLKIVGIEEE